MIELVFDHELTPEELEKLEAEHGPALRYKSGKNVGELKVTIANVPDYDKPKGRMSEDRVAFPGFVAPLPEWASSTPGLYSVAEDVIEVLTLRKDIPFLADLTSVINMTKDLGTYYITTAEDGTSKGMLTLVQPDSIIHHMLNHTSTVTGRFSSSNPNL